MKRWQGSCIGALPVPVIGGSSLLFFVPVGGAMIAGIPPVFYKLTEWAACPDAVLVVREKTNRGPATTSPGGMTGHQEEWTCTFEDGSQKIVSNEEIALKEFDASFIAARV